MDNGIAALEEAIGYRFRDRALLEAALTHRSLTKSDPARAHNQRLEFLGDAVLGLAIAELLYGLYPNEEEGDLSKRFVALVNGEALADIGRRLGLGGLLAMGGGEEEQGGRTNGSNLEDACEALLGAIYLDGGLEALGPVIETFWAPAARALAAPPQDAKTALQEWVQARGLKLPEYRVTSSEGPAHAPNFIIELAIEGQPPVRAEAGTKKQAERLAAERMLAQLGE
ncbi:MAG: ribonuclease III [Alphaproteobacteria bacterium]